MSWPAGTIVVCVNTAPNPERHPDQQYCEGLERLREGSYYTISEWMPGHAFNDGIAGVRLVEVKPANSLSWFDWWRFRRAEASHSESASVRQSLPQRARQ